MTLTTRTKNPALLVSVIQLVVLVFWAVEGCGGWGGKRELDGELGRSSDKLGSAVSAGEE